MKAEAQAYGGTAARALPDGMLPSQRALFDIPREICYLNAASWSPLPIATQDAGRAGVARKGQPWLIDPAHPAAQYERARRAAARLINADVDDVALISSVSYGVAAAGKLVNVPARSRGLVLGNDHSSGGLEWAIRAPARPFSVQGVPAARQGEWYARVLVALGAARGTRRRACLDLVRALVRRRSGGYGPRCRGVAQARGDAAGRCHPRRRRDADRRARPRSRLPRFPHLQVAAGAVRARLSLR